MKARLLLLTFLGGALGSGLRYLISLQVDQSIWLWVVNLLGAFALGLVQVRFVKTTQQAFWATGFAGGFTTLSGLITFSLATVNPGYAVLQVVLGVFIYWLGRILGGERK